MTRPPGLQPSRGRRARWPRKAPGWDGEREDHFLSAVLTPISSGLDSQLTAMSFHSWTVSNSEGGPLKRGGETSVMELALVTEARLDTWQARPRAAPPALARAASCHQETCRKAQRPGPGRENPPCARDHKTTAQETRTSVFLINRPLCLPSTPCLHDPLGLFALLSSTWRFPAVHLELSDLRPFYAPG